MNALPITAALLAALAVGACASGPREAPAPGPRTALDKWPDRIDVQGQPEEILLAAHPTGLSGNQARALSDFYFRWASAGGGEIAVQAPYGAADPAGVHRVQAEARAFLIAQGAPASMVRLTGYDPGAPDAPVVVGFLRHTVVTPDCGAYWGGLTQTRENQPYHSFGCATAANLAAQVANPADLLGPRAMTATDAQRRDTVMGRYRAGEPTSAAAEVNGAGAISNAVN